MGWSPAQPTLYDLELTLTGGDGSRDVVKGYFGLRSLGLTDSAILLNGAPVYQRLVLDQGFYPDGIYTAPSDEALRNDIAISQDSLTRDTVDHLLIHGDAGGGWESI